MSLKLMDFHYSRELHHEHDTYSLMPERLRVCPEWMPLYEIDEDLGMSSAMHVEKLVPSAG